MEKALSEILFRSTNTFIQDAIEYKNKDIQTEYLPKKLCYFASEEEILDAIQYLEKAKYIIPSPLVEYTSHYNEIRRYAGAYLDGFIAKPKLFDFIFLKNELRIFFIKKFSNIYELTFYSDDIRRALLEEKVLQALFYYKETHSDRVVYIYKNRFRDKFSIEIFIDDGAKIFVHAIFIIVTINIYMGMKEKRDLEEKIHTPVYILVGDIEFVDKKLLEDKFILHVPKFLEMLHSDNLDFFIDK